MDTAKVQPVKIHRRQMDLDGRAFTLLGPRPSNECRFATNYFHQTWHVLSDLAGARLLGRLCWLLAFYRTANTIVVIDNAHLVPNPFDADPSSPIVIANIDRAPLNSRAVNQLKRRLPLTRPPDGSMRLHTPGLDKLLRTDDPSAHLRAEQQRSRVWWNAHQCRGWGDCQIFCVNGRDGHC